MRHLAYRAAVAVPNGRNIHKKIRMKLTRSALYIIAIQAGIRAELVSSDTFVAAQTRPLTADQPLSIVKRQSVAIPPGVSLTQASGANEQTPVANEVSPAPGAGKLESSSNNSASSEEPDDETPELLLNDVYPEDELDEEWNNYLDPSYKEPEISNVDESSATDVVSENDVDATESFAYEKDTYIESGYGNPLPLPGASGIPNPPIDTDKESGYGNPLPLAGGSGTPNSPPYDLSVEADTAASHQETEPSNMDDSPAEKDSQSGMPYDDAMADAADDYETDHKSAAPMHNEIDENGIVFSSANSLATNAFGVLIGLLLF